MLSTPLLSPNWRKRGNIFRSVRVTQMVVKASRPSWKREHRSMLTLYGLDTRINEERQSLSRPCLFNISKGMLLQLRRIEIQVIR